MFLVSVTLLLLLKLQESCLISAYQVVPLLYVISFIQQFRLSEHLSYLGCDQRGSDNRGSTVLSIPYDMTKSYVTKSQRVWRQPQGSWKFHTHNPLTPSPAPHIYTLFYGLSMSSVSLWLLLFVLLVLLPSQAPIVCQTRERTVTTEVSKPERSRLLTFRLLGPAKANRYAPSLSPV